MGTPAMGACETGVGAFCALVVAVILVADPALAASRLRRNEEIGDNCKTLKEQSETCIENAHSKFTKSMENEKAPESDVCTNKVCDYLKAIEECYSHLDSCDDEEENKNEKFKEIVINDDCKSLNTELCPIMKAFVDDNPSITKTLDGDFDYFEEMEQEAKEDGDQDDANEGNQDGDAAPEGNIEDDHSSNVGVGAKSEDGNEKTGDDDTDDSDQNDENDGDDGDNGDGDKDTDESNEDENHKDENNNAGEVNNLEDKKDKSDNDRGNSGKDTLILSTSLLFITLIFSFYLPV